MHPIIECHRWVYGLLIPFNEMGGRVFRFRMNVISQLLLSHVVSHTSNFLRSGASSTSYRRRTCRKGKSDIVIVPVHFLDRVISGCQASVFQSERSTYKQQFSELALRDTSLCHPPSKPGEMSRKMAE